MTHQAKRRPGRKGGAPRVSRSAVISVTHRALFERVADAALASPAGYAVGMVGGQSVVGVADWRHVEAIANGYELIPAPTVERVTDARSVRFYRAPSGWSR